MSHVYSWVSPLFCLCPLFTVWKALPWDTYLLSLAFSKGTLTPDSCYTGMVVAEGGKNVSLFPYSGRMNLKFRETLKVKKKSFVLESMKYKNWFDWTLEKKCIRDGFTCYQWKRNPFSWLGEHYSTLMSPELIYQDHSEFWRETISSPCQKSFHRNSTFNLTKLEMVV